MNADGSGRKHLTDDQIPELLPTWSPDNRKIAFPSQRNGNYQIYVMNSDRSGGVLQLTKIKDLSVSPSWSPDGLTIAFIVYSNKSKTSDLYIMDADGKDPLTSLLENTAT